MISVSDVILYRWFRLGIEDPQDLQWLYRFYHNTDLPLVCVLASLTTARRHYALRAE